MDLRQTVTNDKVASTTRKRDEIRASGYVRSDNFIKATKNLKAITRLKSAEEKSSVEQSKTASLKKLKADSNVHKNHRSRLKAQCIKSGIETLSDVQMIELLLFYGIPQKDTNPIAHELLNKFGNIKNILNAKMSDLKKVNGIKDNTALLIHIINGFMHYTNLPEEKEVLDTTDKTKTFCKRLFVGVNVEQFYVICLGKDNKVIKYKCINTGSADEVPIQIRNITEFAIEQHCNQIIISHNHPIGLGEMSDEDIAFTYKVMCSCLLNDITIVDHIVVGTDFTRSMKDDGIINALENRAFETIKLPLSTKTLVSENAAKYKASNPSKFNSKSYNEILNNYDY